MANPMTLGIMQPYFLPYIGYFQLINAVDNFVIYDQIKYTKKGWINRNRMLQNGKDILFSIPLESGSDFLNICQRQISNEFDQTKFLAKIEGAYRRAPQFEITAPLIRKIVQYSDRNLFNFLHFSIQEVCNHLEIKTKIVVSSEVEKDPSLTAQDRVIGLCESMGATNYINSIGGLELYSREDFAQKGVALKFIKARPFTYEQFSQPFVPWLSILDVLMFNPLDKIKANYLSNFDLITPE